MSTPVDAPADRSTTWGTIFAGVETKDLDIVVEHALQVEGPERTLRYLAKALQGRALGALLAYAVTQLEVIHGRDLDDEFTRMLISVAFAYGVSTTDILGESRRSPVALARHLVMYIARVILEMELTEIGRRMHRDHSTVIHGVERIASMKSIVPDFNTKLLEVIANLHSPQRRG